MGNEMRHELVETETALAAVPAEMVEGAFRMFLRMDVANGDASPDTVRGYLSAARSWLQYCQEIGVNPVAVTEDHVMHYRARLVDYGYKAGTISHRLIVVRRFYEALRWRGIRQDNPAIGVRPPRERVLPEDRVRYLSTEDLRELFASISPETAKGRRDLPMLALMALHGLRDVEIHRLSAADLHLDDQAPSLVARGKTGDRIVYLRQDVADALAAWVAERGEDLEGDAPVFVSVSNRGRGGRISRRGIRVTADGYLARIGSKHTGTHVLRHTAATLALKGGAQIHQIQAMLGHKDPRTTMVYAHVIDRAENNPAALVSVEL